MEIYVAAEDLEHCRAIVDAKGLLGGEEGRLDPNLVLGSFLIASDYVSVSELPEASLQTAFAAERYETAALFMRTLAGYTPKNHF